METNDYRLLLVLRAVDKLTQMSGRSGNELIINRGQYLYQGECVPVPQLSANGLRHAAIREPGGMWLIGQYELGGRLTKEMLRLLTNGGNNATKSGGAESLGRNIAMRQLLPLLGLMGCGLPDGPKVGVLKVSDAVLICNESRDYVAAMAPEIELPQWLRPARTCVGKWTRYRHDPVGQKADLLADPDEPSSHSGMVFGGEAIVPGSLLVSEIHLEGASLLELGALIWSLRLWQSRGGYVGGMSARGNGRTVAMLHCDDNLDLDDAAESYTAYAASVKDDAEEWLRSVFAKSDDGDDKPKRGKKAKAGATA